MTESFLDDIVKTLNTTASRYTHGQIYEWDYYCEHPIMWNKRVAVFEKTDKGYIQCGEWSGDIDNERLEYLIKLTDPHIHSSNINMVIEIWSEYNELDYLVKLGDVFKRQLKFYLKK
jgi:hypothetical protein